MRFIDRSIRCDLLDMDNPQKFTCHLRKLIVFNILKLVISNKYLLKIYNLLYYGSHLPVSIKTKSLKEYAASSISLRVHVTITIPKHFIKAPTYTNSLSLHNISLSQKLSISRNGMSCGTEIRAPDTLLS